MLYQINLISQPNIQHVHAIKYFNCMFKVIRLVSTCVMIHPPELNSLTREDMALVTESAAHIKSFRMSRTFSTGPGL